MGIEQSNGITINNNFCGHIRPRIFDAVAGTAAGDAPLDRVGGILVGSLGYPKQNQNIKVTNNIVAGALYAGFFVMGH